MPLVMLITNQIHVKNPPCRIPGLEPGKWVPGAENGVLQRLSAPDSVIRNLVSPVSEFGV